jgi:hypothetical protein
VSRVVGVDAVPRRLLVAAEDAGSYEHRSIVR